MVSWRGAQLKHRGQLLFLRATSECHIWKEKHFNKENVA
jgi:hypothetical protein